MAERRPGNDSGNEESSLATTVESQESDDSNDDSISLTSTVESEAQEEYPVDRILAEWEGDYVDNGTIGSGKVFLVAWEGYDVLRSSWEPASHFVEGYHGALEEWEQHQMEVQRGQAEAFDSVKWQKDVDKQTWECERRKRKRAKKRDKLAQYEQYQQLPDATQARIASMLRQEVKSTVSGPSQEAQDPVLSLQEATLPTSPDERSVDDGSDSDVPIIRKRQKQQLVASNSARKSQDEPKNVPGQAGDGTRKKTTSYQTEVPKLPRSMGFLPSRARGQGTAGRDARTSNTIGRMRPSQVAEVGRRNTGKILQPFR